MRSSHCRTFIKGDVVDSSGVTEVTALICLKMKYLQCYVALSFIFDGSV